MNKKFVVRNTFGRTVYCILSNSLSYEEQLMEVLNIKPGYGFCVEMRSDAIIVKDYFHGEERGRFDIVSTKDTKEDVCLNWNECTD